jgi:ankyrin repeat protein
MKTTIRHLMRTVTLVAASSIALSGCVLFHKDTSYGHIHEYVLAGDADAVAKDLSEHPNDLNLPDDAGLTPLHLAAAHCQTNVIAVLLAKGAKINAKAKDDATPLHLAAQEGCTAAVAMLFAHNAKVNARDAQGRTPLKRAEEWRQNDIAEILRQHGGVE